MEESENSRFLKPKLRYYNMIKTEFGIDEYVLLNMPKYKRSVIAQFHFSLNQ